MNRKKLPLLIASGILFLATASIGHSQSAHYPAGVEGIKGGTLPPPGWYLRNYSFFYFADEYPVGPPDFDLFAYVQAPRLVYISPVEVLGGYLGADTLIPFVHQDVSATGLPGESSFGLGDIFFEGTLSWHADQFDFGIGYGLWAPTGDFDPRHPSLAGKGYWSQMVTVGGTLFLDDSKLWSLSLLNRYEINRENSDLRMTPGDVWTLEYGLARTFGRAVDIGLSGYYVLQTNGDEGPGATQTGRDEVFGIGPEVSVFWPDIKLFSSLRYVYEIEASHRPQGHLINLTLTKIF